jgi:hypothetical protein
VIIKVFRIISSPFFSSWFSKTKVMEKIVIGVDVSKEKLDFCLLKNGKIVKEWIIANATQAITESLFSLKVDLTKTLVCAEYTGQYTYPLC